jgi:uncharacterized membrane protein
MTDRRLRLAMAALALVTTGIAAYLVYTHYAGGSVVCSTGGCETVERSRYADVFGVPVALVGLLGSAAILLTLARGDLPARVAGVAVTGCGLVFAAYLVVVQLAVLGAVCEWCIANDALVAVLAVLAVLRARPDLRAATTAAV